MVEPRLGYKLLNEFLTYESKSSIFDAFPFMDTREDILRLERDSDSEFLGRFMEFSQSYSENPWNLQRDVWYMGRKNRKEPFFMKNLVNFEGNPENKKVEKEKKGFKPFYPTNYGKSKENE